MSRVPIGVDPLCDFVEPSAMRFALDEARRSGRIKDGDIILMAAFGAGLTWAGAVVRL